MTVIKIEAHIPLAEESTIVVLIKTTDASIQHLARADAAALTVIHLAGVQVECAITAQGATLVIQRTTRLHSEVMGDKRALLVIKATQVEACITFGGKQTGLVEQLPGDRRDQRAVAGERACAVVQAGCIEGSGCTCRQCPALVGHHTAVEHQGAITLQAAAVVVQFTRGGREVGGQKLAAAIVQQACGIRRQTITCAELAALVVQVGGVDVEV